MSTTQPSKPYLSEDEIDIAELARNLVLFLRRNLIMILVFVVAGIIGGIVSFNVLPRQYKVMLIAESRSLTGGEIRTIVDNWQNLLGSGNRKVLAEKFNISPAVITQLSGLGYEETALGESIALEDESLIQRHGFAINAVVSNPQILDSLQRGILYSLENSAYTRQRVNAEKKRLSLLKTKIEQEIAQLDTVRFALQDLIRKGGKGNSPFIAEPGNINTDIVKLYEQLLVTEERLQFINNIQVIEGFDKPDNQDSPRLSTCLIAGAIAGFFAALLVIFIRNI